MDVLFSSFLIVNNALLEKLLILQKDDISYHMCSQSIFNLITWDYGENHRNPDEKNFCKKAKQHRCDFLQSMEERYTCQGIFFHETYYSCWEKEGKLTAT